MDTPKIEPNTNSRISIERKRVKELVPPVILFPYIKKMVNNPETNQAIEAPHFGTVRNPIQMMMEEHDNEGERFRQIAELGHDYTPPADACNTYRVAFALLQEFEDDLHRHIHLENNILFPKAELLETQLLNPN